MSISTEHFYSERYIHPSIADYQDTDLRLCVTLHRSCTYLGISSIQSHKMLCLASYLMPSIEECSYFSALEKLKEEEKLLQANFQYGERVFTVLDFQSTLVPEALYSPKDSSVILSNLFHLHGKECISKEKEPFSNAYILTAFNSSYLRAAKILFSNDKEAQFQSVYGNLIRNLFLISHTYRKFEHHVLLNLRKNEFDLLVKNPDGLLFINTFPYPDFSNLLYYLLYALNKLKLDLGSIALFLSGESLDKDLFSSLGTQFCHIFYLPSPKGLCLPKEAPYNRYFMCL
ncbi:MAG: DUF3822 family protein [Bacteroidales bacterium]